MVQALLVTHGRLGEVLKDIVGSLLGEQAGIQCVSNDGLSAAEIKETLDKTVAHLGGEDRLVLFSDLEGGSCWAMCRAVTARCERCCSVSGLNLPMLIEFCHYRDRLAYSALLERVVRKGREGIRLSGQEGGDPCL
jgi:PTS system mannose-specific IIA component